MMTELVPVPTKDEKKKKRGLPAAFSKLFSGYTRVMDDHEQAPLPVIASYGIPEIDPDSYPNPASSSANEQQIYTLPHDRLTRYAIYSTMATDSTIDSAIRFHIGHALSANSSTGERIKIESVTDEDNMYVKDLRELLRKVLNEDCVSWGYKAALNGCKFPRLYGKQGVGIERIRSDFYTQSQFVNVYEQCGQVAGYTNAWQNPSFGGQIELMPPWKWAACIIPSHGQYMIQEPIWYNARPFDITADNWEDEGLLESQNYGRSVIETCFEPWIDLQQAILSINMSRRNASKQDRLIGVNVGKLNPTKAAQYLNTIAAQLTRESQLNARQSLARGYIPTVNNHIIPVAGDNKGNLDINTLQGNHEFGNIEDVLFHVKRLAAAAGCDPSLLGFGDLAGQALGDGGLIRHSIFAAINANNIRHAILCAIEHICDVHVAYKYNKVFLPGSKPWNIIFNSISSALEREELENFEGRANFALVVGQLVETVAPEFAGMDTSVYKNWIFTDILKMPEDKFAEMFPAKMTQGANAGDELNVLEAAERSPEFQMLRDYIYNTIADFYEGGPHA